MATKNPLALVKEGFGDKSKLVATLEKVSEGLWLDRTNKNKGLAHVSNAKLLRLLATFTEVKERFGTRDRLIDAVLEQQQRAKDAGLRQRLSAWPVPRLYDTYTAWAKRTGVAATQLPKESAKATEKKAAAPSASAKPRGATAAKKTAPKKAAAAGKTAAKPEKKAAKKGAPAPAAKKRRT